MRALHFGCDGASLESDRRHAAGPRILFSFGEPAGLGQAFQLFHPCRPPPVVRPILAHETASCRSANSCLISAVESSVSHGEPRFSGADDVVGDGFLALYHFVDPLFQRAHANELMNLNIALLSDAKRAVGGLVFNSGVPPTVEVEDVVRGREIQPRAPSLERQDEQTGNAVASVLKALYHLVWLCRGHAAMQEECCVAEGGGKVPLQPLAHIDKLREDQGRIAFCEQLLHHFGQTRQLSRAAGERRLIPQKLRGMIADLLEFGESRENDALAPDALGGLER